VLGAQISPYLQKGEWQFGTSYRQFTADTQYQGTGLSQPVTQNGTQVISKMNALELTGAYGISRQWNAVVGVPLIARASSNRALPANIAGSPRFVHNARGIGDISFGVRRWLLNCENNADQNMSLGLSVKAPTGDSDVEDVFPNALGQDVRSRVVDQSIQLGDSGWGFSVSFEAFKQLADLTAFGSGVYLFNPRGQTDTPSPPALLNPAGPQAVDSRFRFNSVSDSYLFRAGFGYPFKPVAGLSMFLAGRVEGVPRRDAFGGESGFRRPGYFAAIEPGVNYARGRTILSFSAPIRIHQNVKADVFGIRRDSTFADHMFLITATYRLGGNYGDLGPAVRP
jgi:hypothetical protein